MSYQLIDYITIYAKEWDNLVTEFLRHLAMTSFAGDFCPPPGRSTWYSHYPQ